MRIIGIVGHFADNKEFYDGQTVKTRTLYNLLSKYDDIEIIKVDTNLKNENVFKLIYESLRLIYISNDLIVLLSGNGMKVYFPILYIVAKIFNKRIYHCVIGGNLDRYVERNRLFKYYLNSFKINWVESNFIHRKLSKLGIKNCDVIPNFKQIQPVDNISAINKYKKFCTFSRVIKEKGIEEAIDAIVSINNDGKYMCFLDIYGPVDKEYKNEFFYKISQYKNVTYKGIVNYNKSVDVLSGYFALLFPTYWDGEGFPGTIIDAFNAGIPVIATDWNCNSEIIDDKINGIIYPNNDIRNLKEAIIYMIEEKKYINYKINSLKSAVRFKAEVQVEKIYEFISRFK